MRARAKRVLLAGWVVGAGLLGLGTLGLFLFGSHHAHQHCLKQAGLAFRLYSQAHDGRLPFSTNGFGDALLLLAKEDPSVLHCLSAPGDDGRRYREALANHTVLPEEFCSRVYIQGLSATNDPQLCLLFDRHSCPGGDHSRAPWRPRVREVCLMDGSMQVVTDGGWPAFCETQISLLVSAGFSRSNALRFYQASR